MSEMIQRRGATAAEAYDRDYRFRNIVQSIVAHEMNAYGPIDPDRAALAAHRIATAVAATLLQTIYEGDAELREQKAMADRYRKIAEGALMTSNSPPAFLVQNAEKPPAS